MLDEYEIKFLVLLVISSKVFGQGSSKNDINKYGTSLTTVPNFAISKRYYIFLSHKYTIF